MEQRIYQVHASDNVAVAMEDLMPGPAAIYGAGSGTVTLTEPIPRGFKAALADIEEGADVVKYAHAIARATAPIRAGACVHVHNAKSFLDDRSNAMDGTNTASRLQYEL